MGAGGSSWSICWASSVHRCMLLLSYKLAMPVSIAANRHVRSLYNSATEAGLSAKKSNVVTLKLLRYVVNDTPYPTPTIGTTATAMNMQP